MVRRVSASAASIGAIALTSRPHDSPVAIRFFNGDMGHKAMAGNGIKGG
jgi:hypothetical protein